MVPQDKREKQGYLSKSPSADVHPIRNKRLFILRSKIKIRCHVAEVSRRPKQECPEVFLTVRAVQLRC